MTAFTAVDLSRLPPPAAVEIIDFEVIYADMRAQLIALGIDFDAFVESDPLICILQFAAYREANLRADFNDRVRAVMPAFATGADLDNIAARYFVQRLEITPADPVTNTPAVMESDDDLRRRMMLAFEGFSVAGPEGAYIFHALSAHPGVADASATSPQPGDVLVTILGREGDGVPSSEIRDAVIAHLRDDDVRPLTDNVLVGDPEILPYAVEIELYTFAGAGAEVAVAEAQAAVEAFVASSRRLGRDIVTTALLSAAYVDGVQRAVLISPTEDITCDRTQAAHCTGIEVTHVGVDE